MRKCASRAPKIKFYRSKIPLPGISDTLKFNSVRDLFRINNAHPRDFPIIYKNKLGM